MGGGKKPPKGPEEEEEDDPMNNPELVKIIIGQLKYQLKMERMMVSESIKLHMEKIDEKLKTDYIIHSAPKSENIWIDSGISRMLCLLSKNGPGYREVNKILQWLCSCNEITTKEDKEV